ncbi:unnamed protein product [Gongylonema pulchrum]|uniref:Secreted protein n=1 Tax=Gongylonema pulchrum TaxID=637853 RepID=A0A183CZ09_9BILA|nr:unnamed protein product [Gongylonema pulchrum]
MLPLFIMTLSNCSFIAQIITLTAADDGDYDYLDDDLIEDRKPADVFWGDILDGEQNDNNGSSGSEGLTQRKCATDTAIIDKLLNGTGYNKYRLPRKYCCFEYQIYFLSITYSFA